MILYTNIPGDIIMSEQTKTQIKYIKKGNCIYSINSPNSNNHIIERLISTNPKDYLKLENMPGQKF